MGVRENNVIAKRIRMKKPGCSIARMLYEIRAGRYGTPDEVIAMQHDYKKYKLKSTNG